MDCVYLLLATCCVLLLQWTGVHSAADNKELVVKEDFYEVKVFVTKTKTHSVDFTFNTSPAVANNKDYYYCIQATLRWTEFEPACVETVAATPDDEWIFRSVDGLDYWNRDYHLRVTLCRKVSEYFVYCDGNTRTAQLVARSQTVTFHTKDGELADTQEVVEKPASFYQVDVKVTDIGTNSVDFVFRANPAAANSSYYYCLQTTPRWERYQDNCDKAIASLPDSRWISESIDNLEHWGTDYSLRITLCRKVTQFLVYCDGNTKTAVFVVRSRDVRFYTVNGDAATGAWTVTEVLLLVAEITVFLFLVGLVLGLCKRNRNLKNKLNKASREKFLHGIDNLTETGSLRYRKMEGNGSEDGISV